MKYQKFMKKVMEQLTGYKGTVGTLATSYQLEVARREEELTGTKGKYTDEYIKESRRNWKSSKDYSGEISRSREKHQKIALAYIDQIPKELDSYFQIPVDSGFAATVTAIKALGVTPNNREFDLLQGASGGYWGRRLLNELAISRTKTEQGAENTSDCSHQKPDCHGNKCPFNKIVNILCQRRLSSVLFFVLHRPLPLTLTFPWTLPASAYSPRHSDAERSDFCEPCPLPPE